ncbi:YphA family membrane protein [Anoxybacillus kestanbolensis]|uniref:YphA family membrane protein n=1 Tax=Anoxybacillus kestanbolensis TaxID=227476 RepID=UPI003D1F86B8
MEGGYFYWLSWCLWMIYTFFAPKNRVRLLICLYILLLITLSAHDVTIYSFHMSLAYILMLMVSYSFAMKKTGISFIYFAFASASMTMLYAAFHFLLLFDPVWVFAEATWLLALVLLFTSFVLYRSFYDRFLVLTVSCCQGDFLYAFVLKQFSFPHPIGSLLFLDGWALATACLFIWEWLEQLPMYIDTRFQKRAKEAKT